MLDQISRGGTNDQARRGWVTGAVGALSAAVVVTLVLAGLGSPAQAHHRPSHAAGPAPSPSPSPSPTSDPSPSPSPSATESSDPSGSVDRTPTTLSATGTHFVYPYFCVFGTIVCADRLSYVRGRVTSTGGSDAGRGVAGLTVSVVHDLSDSPVTATTDAGGWFQVGVAWSTDDVLKAQTGPVTWAASTDGNQDYAGSSSSGVFVTVPAACLTCP